VIREIFVRKKSSREAMVLDWGFWCEKFVKIQFESGDECRR
jgi:hypothetical protein